MDVFKDINKLISYSEEGIFSKVILKEDNLNVTLFSMAKDTEISDHTAKKSGFVYVLEGNGVFTLEGNDIAMSKGTFIPLKKDQVHSLKSFENTSFILALS